MWLDRRDADGSRTQWGTLDNDRSGTWTQQGYFESETPWGASGSSWSTSDSYTAPGLGLGFLWPSWSQQEDWHPGISVTTSGGLSHSGNYFLQWNENEGSGSGSGSGSGTGTGAGGNPPPPVTLPVIPEFGDIEFPLTTPNRDALSLNDWLAVMYPGHSLAGTEPPSENEWNPWDTVTDTVGAGWSPYRTTLRQQANQVRDVGRAVSGFIADTGANTRNPWIGGAAGFAAGLLDMTTNIIAAPILDPLTTAEDSIYGTIDTYNTYAEQGGVLLGLSAATGVHRLGEAIGGADILDGRTLSGDEVFDRATEGVGNALGTGATIGGSIVGGARALGYKGFKPHVDVAKTAATSKLDDAADSASMRTGHVISDAALDQLERALLRDRITVSRNADKFLKLRQAQALTRVYPDGSATLYLRSGVTRYQLLHELQHLEHLREIGPKAYISSARTKAGQLLQEQYVYDKLRNYHWDSLTLGEQLDAQAYIRSLNGNDW